MTAILTAIATTASTQWQRLNAVWVSQDGVASVPQLVLMWVAIAAVATVLIVLWWRREKALRRSVERLREVLRRG